MTVALSDRPLCGAKTRSGGRCARSAGWGTGHLQFGRCSSHGGSTRNHVRAAALEQAAAAVVAMGLPVDLEPHEALERCIAITAGELAWLDARVRVLDEGDVLPVSGELHAWVRARQATVDRLARLAKMALDADVDERRTALVEGAAALLEPVLRGIFDALELTADQRVRAPAIVVEHLRQLEAPAPGEGDS